MVSTVAWFFNGSLAFTLNAVDLGPEEDSDNSGVLAAKMHPWVDASLAGMNNGMRRPDSELVIAFVNYPSAGVVSSSRQHFLLHQITHLAHMYPRGFVGVLVLPNRAADLRNLAKSFC